MEPRFQLIRNLCLMLSQARKLCPKMCPFVTSESCHGAASVAGILLPLNVMWLIPYDLRWARLRRGFEYRALLQAARSLTVLISELRHPGAGIIPGSRISSTRGPVGV